MKPTGLVKLLVAALVAILVLLPSGGAFAQDGLSESLFPDAIEGLPLQEIEPVEPEDWEREDYGVEECYLAYYYDEYNDVGSIVIDITSLESENKLPDYLEEMVDATQYAYEYIRDAEFGTVRTTTVDGYPAKYFDSTTYRDLDVYYEYTLDLFVAVSNYLIIITLNQDEGTPSVSQAERVAEYFVTRLKDEEETEEPTQEPTTQVDTALVQARETLIGKVDLLESATLTAVLFDDRSYFYTAVESKIRFGFVVGQLLEKHKVDLRDLKEQIGSVLYEQLDFAYDLEKIDTLRSYCRDEKDFHNFAAGYREYAEEKVNGEFAFDKARTRIADGSEELREQVQAGEMDKVLNMTGSIVDELITAMNTSRVHHYESMLYSQGAAKDIIESTGIIDKLAGFAKKWFNGKLDKTTIAAELSLVWAQNQVRYWTTMAYLWGGTDVLGDNWLEELREKYSLFEREEFYYGPVYAVEDGIEELVEQWR